MRSAYQLFSHLVLSLSLISLSLASGCASASKASDQGNPNSASTTPASAPPAAAAAPAAATPAPPPESAMLNGEPTLTVTIGGASKVFTRSQLIGHKDATSLTFKDDTAYKGSFPFTTRAVPLTSLIEGMKLPAESLLEFVALDGFASQVPLDLVLNKDKAKSVAYVAIETPDKPWPAAVGKKITPAPYYLVWTNRNASQVRDGLWPYKLMKITSVDPPHKRWPALAVDEKLSSGDPIRWGQALYVKNCISCHTLNGAGSGTAGPDLNLPMNATEYLTPQGIKGIIRDPAAVRNWPDRHMQGFPASKITDREIDQLIGYLKHMAGRKNLAQNANPPPAPAGAKAP